MDKETAVFHSLEIIEKRIAEKLTVENISNSVYFSKYYYQRLFREIVGESVMDYVIKRKLTLAGRELLETDNSILDIALKFGYDSHEGFTRSFKAYMGVTPKEYRKYGLASISQKLIMKKERLNNMYSNNTDEIIREFNDFIVKAKEMAKYARKETIPEYARFWNTAADIIDEIADNIKNTLKRGIAAGEKFDEITNLFNIVKTIDDTAYKLNMLSLYAAMTVARGIDGHTKAQAILCEKIRDFAFFTAKKSILIHQLLKELSALIFADMRKTASEKIQDFGNKCKSVTEKINGYAYLKEEITNISNKILSIPYDELTMPNLENRLMQLEALSFSVLMDVSFRDPDNKSLYDGLIMLKENFSETVDFFKTIARLKYENEHLTKQPSPVEQQLMIREDMVHFGNILMFYAKSEISHEKLGRLLSSEQKDALNAIFNKMGDCLQFTSNSTDSTDSIDSIDSTDKSAYKKIAAIFRETHESMKCEVNRIEPPSHRQPLLVIAEEIGSLADKLEELAECVK